MNAAVARVWSFGTSTYTNAASSLRVVDTWRPQLYELVSDAVNRAESEGVAVSIDALTAAFTLSALLVSYRCPEITIEASGEISFEWYKDRTHVAVLTTDGQFLRWAAMLGPDMPVSGKWPFTAVSTELPMPVSEAIVIAS